MKQPKSLYLLFFVEMWERFSYYGMRALLVLFMIEQLHWSDFRSIGVYALYTALVEIGALGGGYIADRVLGLRPTILLGGSLIALGHLSLTFESTHFMFFVGLGLIVTGSSLFISNIKALLGLFYDGDDPRREAGYTLFYMGINVGGFLAALLCGFIGQTFGWHKGFGLAAFGMLLGLGALIFGKHYLEGRGGPPQGIKLRKKVSAIALVSTLPIAVAAMLQQPTWFGPLLPFVGVPALAYLFSRLRGASLELRRSIMALLGCVVLLMLFFSFEELMGSLLVVFSERYVNRSLLGISLPSSVLIGINPLTIILFGWILSRKKRAASQPLSQSMARAFLLSALAFALLFAGTQTAQGLVSIAYVALSFLLIAAGELFLAPPIFAHATRIAPEELKGILMAIVVMGFSYASLLSGLMGQTFTLFQSWTRTSFTEMGQYGLFFGTISAICLLIGSGLALAGRIRKLFRRRAPA